MRRKRCEGLSNDPTTEPQFSRFYDYSYDYAMEQVGRNKRIEDM